jgi:hypothetical protein
MSLRRLWRGGSKADDTLPTVAVCATGARKELLRSGDNPPFVSGEGSAHTVSYSRPVFMSSRDFDQKTAIWDSPAWTYGRKRLAEVLHRQWNVLF